MKAFFALALLAVGFLVAGCGAGTKTGSLTVTGPTTTTVSHVTTRDLISCKPRAGASVEPGARVPAPDEGVVGFADGRNASSSGKIQLTRRQDGSLVVVCSS
ncbi:MAG: hypothetical protein WAL31_13560 [Gaiellaceae bacterium]